MPNGRAPPTMITRSKARVIARHRAATGTDESVMVSPSATGQGTHTRWAYPVDEQSFRIHEHGIDHTATYILTESLSSISSGSSTDDQPFLTPDSSCERSITPEPETPRQNHRILTTSPSLTPKKLQRSPGLCRWVTVDGVTRLLLTHDSPEKATARDIVNEIRLNRIAERELETLLRQREVTFGQSDGVSPMDMDLTTEASGSWLDDGMSEITMEIDDEVTEPVSADYTPRNSWSPENFEGWRQGCIENFKKN